jgi:hypothetical protein
MSAKNSILIASAEQMNWLTCADRRKNSLKEARKIQVGTISRAVKQQQLEWRAEFA